VNILQALPLALLGGLLGLDVVSFPQAMVSRPIVASTLAGTFIGHPESGLLIGIVLELIALDTLPFGASRYPEWGSAGVVGGALFSAEAHGMPGALRFSPHFSPPASAAGAWWFFAASSPGGSKRPATESRKGRETRCSLCTSRE